MIRDDIVKKKQLINKRTQNKRNCKHKNEDQIQQKKIKIKWLGFNKKIKSNKKRLKAK